VSDYLCLKLTRWQKDIYKAGILSLRLYLAKLDILKIESFRLGKISEIAQNAGRILLLHSLSYCYYRLIGNMFIGECFRTWLFESQEDIFEVGG